MCLIFSVFKYLYFSGVAIFLKCYGKTKNLIFSVIISYIFCAILFLQNQDAIWLKVGMAAAIPVLALMGNFDICQIKILTFSLV